MIRGYIDNELQWDEIAEHIQRGELTSLGRRKEDLRAYQARMAVLLTTKQRQCIHLNLFRS